MFIHWVISFRILLTDVQNNPMFTSLFKSFENSAQRSGTETRSLQGAVQLFLISEIYTITTENLRPRYFLYQQCALVDFQATCSAGVLSRSLRLGGAVRVASCHLPVVLMPRSFHFLDSVSSHKMGAVLRNEANRTVVKRK